MQLRMRFWYGLTGLVLVLAVLLCGLFAPQLSHVDPFYKGPFASNMVFVQEKDLSPAAQVAITPHPAPFHASPEDWSRLVYGARWTLLFGVSIAAGRLLVGLAVGTLAGMGGNFWKWLVGRLYMFTSGVPPMLVYVLLFVLPVLRLYPQHLRTWFTVIYVAILVLLESPRVMLVVQGRLEELQNEPFYEGAIAAGNTRWGAWRRHLLPHLTPTLLTQFASEAARGLLVIATLGVFNIFLSGIKVDPLFSPDGALIGHAVSALMPEWGTMLAETLSSFGGISTRPLLPATAFAVLIIGFMLLADGMEALLELLRRPLVWLRYNTRLWHYAAVAAGVALLGVLGYHQGLPWGKYDGATRVLQGEIDALAAGQKAAFLAPIAADAAPFRAEQDDLFDSLAARKGSITGTVSGMRVIGNKAAAIITLVDTLPDGSHLRLARHALLVRRWGVWQDEGNNLYDYRTRLTEFHATFNPFDTTDKGAFARSDLQDLATFADQVVAKMVQRYPHLLDKGPLPVTLFPTDDALAASLGRTPAELGGIYLWYKPGESLRFSAGFRHGENVQIMEERMQQQLTKLAIAQAAPNVTPALAMAEQGSMNQFAAINLRYSDRWVGLPLLTPAELLRFGPGDFDGVIGQVRQLQAINLYQWLEQKGVPPGMMGQATQQPPDQALQTLQHISGLTEEQLSTQYRADTLAYLKDLSLLKSAEGRARIPAEVLAALPAIAEQRSKVAGVPLTISPLKVEMAGPSATAYVLVERGTVAGVERWELVRWKDAQGTRWLLLDKDSWLLPIS